MVDSIGELDQQIRSELDFTAEDMNHYFLFKEQGEKLMVQERRWLPPSMGGLRLKRLMERLGAKREEHNGKARFIIEKGREVGVPANSEVAPGEQLEPSMGPQPVTTKNNSKNSYDLKTSVQILPMLKTAFPIVKDQNGIVIDGFHRLGVDKEWNDVTVEIENENQRKIARFVANFCRRDITEKEKRDFVTSLHLETGWSPKEMAERTPMTYSWIMKYLPDKYKDQTKAEAGAIGGIASGASRREAKYDVSHGLGSLVPCEICNVGVSEPVQVEGHFLCDKHGKEAKEDPSILEKIPKPLAPRKLGDNAKEYKPKDTWAYRKSLMSLPESKVDVDVLEEMQRRGHKIDWQPTVVLVWTKPEYFIDEKAYFYNDGEEVHKGKDDRDDALREMLADKTGKLVYGIPYKVHSKKNVKGIADFMEEKVGKIE